jgi:hypothetical protein
MKSIIVYYYIIKLFFHYKFNKLFFANLNEMPGVSIKINPGQKSNELLPREICQKKYFPLNSGPKNYSHFKES